MKWFSCLTQTRLVRYVQRAPRSELSRVYSINARPGGGLAPATRRHDQRRIAPRAGGMVAFGAVSTSEHNSYLTRIHFRLLFTCERNWTCCGLQKPQAVQGSWPLAPAVDKTSEKIGPQKRTAGQWEDTEDGGKHCR